MKFLSLDRAGFTLTVDKAVRNTQKDEDDLPSTTSAETRASYEQVLSSAKQAAARAAAGK